ncbi:MAG: hypothetical protein II576_11275 [Prevotella sp.]|nr:hypothetical protein [Prevotella sp.]
MKKLVYFAALLLTTVFASCEKEEIGGTATQATAGQWYVTVDAADGNGNLVAGLEDMFSLGRVTMLTFNTAENNPNEMIVSDIGNFWNFSVKVATNQQTLTFQTNTTENNNLVPKYEDINVTITNGKIMPKAGRQNNGSPADSIVFYVSFSDDPYPAAYGYANYRVSGIRYSGLEEND